jgi:hypothetical protein
MCHKTCVSHAPLSHKLAAISAVLQMPESTPRRTDAKKSAPFPFFSTPFRDPAACTPLSLSDPTPPIWPSLSRRLLTTHHHTRSRWHHSCSWPQSLSCRASASSTAPDLYTASAALGTARVGPNRWGPLRPVVFSGLSPWAAQWEVCVGGRFFLPERPHQHHKVQTVSSASAMPCASLLLFIRMMLR